MGNKNDVYRCLAASAECSDVVVHHDFESVAVLNAWTRRQQSELKFSFAIFIFTFQVVSYMLEYVALIYVLTPSTENRSHVSTAVMLVCTMIVAYLFTLLLEPVGYRQFCQLTPRDCVWALLKLIIYIRPFRQVRTLLFQRAEKMKILGREFIHGNTPSRDELMTVIRINREELVDCRHELYECYLQSIPMALLQLYYVTDLRIYTEYCTYRELWQTTLVFVYLFSAIKCGVLYEWKKFLYNDSLHVQEYLRSCGRYKVPEPEKFCPKFFLLPFFHATSLCSRFFLISFMMGTHWGLGLATLFLLYIANMFIIVVNPAYLTRVENLPEGITLTPCYFLDRWVNVFTAKDTRIFELTRRSWKIGRFKFRCPLIFTQLLTYVGPYLILYSFLSLYLKDAKKLGSFAVPRGFLIQVGYPNNISNISISRCHLTPHPDNTNFLRIFNDFMSSISSMFKMRLTEGRGIFQGNEFYWICFYLLFFSVCCYNYISAKYPSGGESYPVKLSCHYFQIVFEKIRENVSMSPERFDEKNMVKRLMLLMSVDLDTFYDIHNSVQGRPIETSEKWWDDRISSTLERCDFVRTRYRSGEVPPPSLEGLPLRRELERAASLMEGDGWCLRLVNFCIRRIDDVLTTQITSDRIESTLGIFGIDKKEAYLKLCAENGSTTPLPFSSSFQQPISRVHVL